MSEPSVSLVGSGRSDQLGIPHEALGRGVLLAVGGPLLQRTVLSAAGPSTKVVCCGGDGAALREVFGLEPTAVVVEIGGGETRLASRLVSLVRGRWPMAIVIGYCLPGAEKCRELSPSATACLDAILFAGRAHVRDFLYQGFAKYANGPEREVQPQPFLESLHPLACQVAEHVLAHAAVAPNVNDVARALGCSPRTLARRFARAGLLTPDTLVTRLRWSRIADLLSARQIKLSDVAMASGFADIKAMRAALKRRFGIGLKQLAEAETSNQLHRSLLHDFRADRAPGSRTRAD